MTEGSVYLDGEVEAFVAEADVGAENCFQDGLPGYVTVFAVFKTDTATVQVGDAVGVSAVAVGFQSCAVWRVEDT